MKLLLVILLMFSSPSSAEEIDLDKLLHLENVKVLKVELDGIRIMHRDGVQKLQIADLPQALIEHYKFNTKESKDALEAAKSNYKERLAKLAILKKAKLYKFFVISNLDDGLVVGKRLPSYTTYRPFVNSLQSIGGGRIYGKGGSTKTYKKNYDTRYFIPHAYDTRAYQDDRYFEGRVLESGIIRKPTVNGGMATMEVLKLIKKP